jgi:hypothetical protein
VQDQERRPDAIRFLGIYRENSSEEWTGAATRRTNEELGRKLGVRSAAIQCLV